MAAPPEKTLKDLSGTWVMNKTLSDDTDSILQMQGVGWFLRKAISLATVTLSVEQYINDDPSENTTHIDIKQTATGGIQGTTECRTLDWTFRPHKDGIFGSVKGRSRWIKLAALTAGDGTEEADLAFLKEGWEDGPEAIQSYVESVDNGWTANQIWGFEIREGTRYYVRHVVVRKGEDWKQARLVYDWRGVSAKVDEDDDGLAYED